MQKPILLLCLALILAVTGVALGVRASTSSTLEDALVAQIELAEQRPNSDSVFNDLGNLLTLAGDLERAEGAYRRAVEIEPARAIPRFNLALLLQQRGKMDGAVRELKEVIRLDPEHAWAHYQLGAIAEARGDEKTAVRQYARAFALDSDLSFPETNPHIIENKLVVPAFLKAFRSVEEPGAPKSYDDAGRIASLLAPVPPTFSSSWQLPERTEATPEAEGLEEAVEVDAESPLRQPLATNEDGTDVAESPAPAKTRVLTQQDLKPGRVNQASAPGHSLPRQRSGGLRSSDSDARLRTWSRTRQPDVTNEKPPAGGTPGATPQAPGTRDVGGSVARPEVPGTSIRSRYRPGLRSTGSLDTQLVPEAPPKPAFG